MKKNNKDYTFPKEIDLIADKAKELDKYESKELFTWCGGCGNYAMMNAIKNALVLENIPPHRVQYCFDVGCNGNASDKIQCNTIHGLHGRVISLAAGCKLANPGMTVIAAAGDGATFSEGINHLVHSVRNNYPIIFIHHNNENYGLTTGQASSTTRENAKMNGTPDGVYTPPLNPLSIVLNLHPSFVARSFSGDVIHMTKIFHEALIHDGFAFVEVLQTCPTYNRDTPQKWYEERIKLIEDKADYDNTDIWQARKIVEDIEEEIYLGILYKNPNDQSFLKRIPNRKNTNTFPIDEVNHFDITKLLEEL